MTYVDEFRDAARCRGVLSSIRALASRSWTIMEVCGGQTHGLLRWGIDEELRGIVELLHGPGCPVCVAPAETIDVAAELAMRKDTAMTTFGDMLRVPGSRDSLRLARARGGNVRTVYSPLDAVQLAKEHPELQVVFFAVGFETTAPATALAVQQAENQKLDNFSLLVAHVRVQPAMEMLTADKDCPVDGFLAAGHVCTVAGYESYREFVNRFRLPVVVTGFEPVDLLYGISDCVTQLEDGRAELVNCYARSAANEGNIRAREIVNDVYEICDRPWRGMGNVPDGGLQLHDRYAHFDAQHRFAVEELPVIQSNECRSGDVLAGRIKPTACEAFGSRCTPDSPLGAPMVSSEGACAAYYRYARGAADCQDVKT